jgi:hypothetical protein
MDPELSAAHSIGPDQDAIASEMSVLVQSLGTIRFEISC